MPSSHCPINVRAQGKKWVVTAPRLTCYATVGGARVLKVGTVGAVLQSSICPCFFRLVVSRTSPSSTMVTFRYTHTRRQSFSPGAFFHISDGTPSPFVVARMWRGLVCRYRLVCPPFTTNWCVLPATFRDKLLHKLCVCVPVRPIIYRQEGRRVQG